MKKGALFSKCRKYRYALWRIWDDEKPNVMFIGLNPSVADAETDDPTIRRVIGFAKKWGYGGVFMLNLFTYISTEPDNLLKAEDPARLSDHFIAHYWLKCEKIIFAWGGFEFAKERAKEVMKYYNGYILMRNKDGSPRHLLYVPYDVEIKRA